MKVVYLLALGLGCCQALRGPEPGKVYAIQSLDGGYLRPVGNGTICKNLSKLHVSHIDPVYPPEEYHWTVTIHDLFGTTIHHKLPNGFAINELTYDDAYPPYCYLIYREIELDPIYSTFVVKNIRTNKCLCSKGFEGDNTVTWEDWEACEDPGKQWFFREIPV